MSAVTTLPRVVNVREARTIQPRVTLGLPRRDLVADTLSSLAPRTSGQILADRDRAVAERDAREASRADVLLTGTAADVANLDHSIALAKVRIEQAEAQHAVALVEEADARAEADAEHKRRKALHKAGMKASTEAAKLADQYIEVATKLATLLGQIRECERVIADANRCLPNGADPVPPGEPFNGKAGIPATYDTSVEQIFAGMGPDKKPMYRRNETRRFVPGAPAVAHIPLSHRVRLPALALNEAPIWGVDYTQRSKANDLQS